MDCVSEGSYHILYIVAIILAILFLLISAYFWDRFNKTKTRNLTKDETKQGEMIALIGVILAIISIAILILLFFAFKKRMKGVIKPIHDISYDDALP